MRPPDLIVITGASGFLGRHLTRHLAAQGHRIRAAARRPDAIAAQANVTPVPMPDLMRPADWGPLLAGASHVVHLAGIAHRSASDADHARANHRATTELAEAAAGAGIAQLIFVSSIYAQTPASSGHVLREDDPATPDTAYGRAKLAAERAIAASGVPFTVLRPVVIDGVDAKGNLALIRRLARSPLPLPLGGLRNRRSILSVENINSAVTTVLSNPAAIGETFIAADPEALTVGEMIARLRRAAGRGDGLFSIPAPLLRLAVTAIGGRGMWQRLAGPLEADPGKLIRLGWRPIPPKS